MCESFQSASLSAPPNSLFKMSEGMSQCPIPSDRTYILSTNLRTDNTRHFVFSVFVFGVVL